MGAGVWVGLWQCDGELWRPDGRPRVAGDVLGAEGAAVAACDPGVEPAELLRLEHAARSARRLRRGVAGLGRGPGELDDRAGGARAFDLVLVRLVGRLPGGDPLQRRDVRRREPGGAARAAPGISAAGGAKRAASAAG